MRSTADGFFADAIFRSMASAPSCMSSPAVITSTARGGGTLLACLDFLVDVSMPGAPCVWGLIAVCMGASHEQIRYALVT